MANFSSSLYFLFVSCIAADDPKTNILEDDCTSRKFSSEIFSLTREIGNGGVQHPKTIVSQNAKFLEHFYELVPGKGGNPPTLKIANYPHLVLHFLAPYMNMMGDQLLQRALQGIKTQPVSKEPQIQSLLDKMEALWCAEAIKIASPKTPVQLFQCGNNG
ncbi:hypothetical protein DdX_22456 [Ditylenchus destructor]|uniref:Uncharacterized protein n=1 Tax=Ditylenchus destructor TaxID=166010 RepID=A0AAD4MET7_9BILA|nr:hypothetical protein DdX_22456 [Ditylenchus destructor]